jgi:hypothetical protein
MASKKENIIGTIISLPIKRIKKSATKPKII